ncbi:EscD/YscD/HrpQ family type III secretion system inner membrane ring protein [Pandoraea vervacti]|uniref:EscD/YscD/HrpQ family type III secretion system inner membrane ring protein n=1 Tax=Pandoraea vervacti TaxID=656178 RepID=A0ABN4FM34_9BURK|nr:type III secretion system inner membrane ring subunit SctD [Pandoraea vervacti]AJP56488.1 EscD/YscD/HrpQ family type III secretion system inner membrane ring protein [Pandoraea vervacti]
MLTLTLLDGPLAGRPVPLPRGELTIGTAESDIAMTLDDGASATLHVDSEGVRLATGTPVWVNGAALASENTPSLPLHTVIDLAGLGIWLSDGSLPTPMPLPKCPVRAIRPMQPMRGATSATPSDAPAMAAPPDERKAGRSPLAWLAATGLSLLIAGAGIAIWRTGTANVIAVPPTPDALKALAARIAPNIELSTAGDAVRLSGGCLDDNTRARLRAEARWLGKALSDETWCPASAVRTASTLLRLHGFGSAQVSVAKDGALLIGGPLIADARWRAASDALDALSLPHGWRVADGTANSFERLLTTLRHAGQLRGVDISRDRNGWRLTGVLPAGRLASLKGIADAWNLADNAMPLRIDPLAPPVPTLAETGFSAPLVSIGGSPGAPQITLADGTRLAQGIRLPGGTQIVAIHPDGVSISGHDRLFYLPLTPETFHDDSPDPA